MEGTWNAGIFHGVGRPLRQVDPAAAQQVIEDAIASGSERAMDAIDKRYGTQISLLLGAVILTAAATAVLAFIAISKEVK